MDKSSDWTRRFIEECIFFLARIWEIRKVRYLLKG